MDRQLRRLMGKFNVKLAGGWVHFASDIAAIHVHA
jgi:hypothetical protein